MPLLESIYAATVAALRPALPLLARGEGKLARGVRGRVGVEARMEAWARAHRDPRRPLVWFHAASVGEGLQAGAVLRALQRRRPDLQLAYTWFSPSAEAFGRGLGADFADYLPLDHAAGLSRALDALRPHAIVFSKYDVWPVLTRLAAERGIPLLLLSATLPPGAGRLGLAARALLRPAYARLTRVAAISADDAARFGGLGVPAERRSVMGDARFDQVWERAAHTDRGSPLLAALRGDGVRTLVAGSTWGEDEAVLLPAIAACLRRDARIRLIIAPHEPTPGNLAALESRLRELRLAHVRLSAVERGEAATTVVVVDRVGVLGELYSVGDVAWVGGGFGRAGLHSVLEPAAFGIPVLFGPHHANAREASELIAAGGAFEVDRADAAGVVERMLSDGGAAGAAGGAARRYVESRLGAAERGAQLIADLLPPAPVEG